MKVRLFRWRGSYAVRIPTRIVKAANLREGNELVARVSFDGAIELHKMNDEMTLKRMVDAITPKNSHRPTDWGCAVGLETW